MVESARRAQPEVTGLASAPEAVPLHGSTSVVAPTPSDGLTAAGVHLLPPASRHVFHGNAAARAAAALWGSFPEEACRARVQGPRAALWLGPDEYLLLGPAADSQADGMTALERALDGIPHALVDVSHRQVALQLSGPHAATLLNAGCPLDLDIGEFPVGMCTRTVFTKADIVLWRTGPDTFHVEVWRSFAGYLVGLFREIGLEFAARD